MDVPRASAYDERPRRRPWVAALAGGTVAFVIDAFVLRVPAPALSALVVGALCAVGAAVQRSERTRLW
jgi:hypothetical protein